MALLTGARALPPALQRRSRARFAFIASRRRRTDDVTHFAAAPREQPHNRRPYDLDTIESSSAQAINRAARLVRHFREKTLGPRFQSGTGSAHRRTTTPSPGLNVGWIRPWKVAGNRRRHEQSVEVRVDERTKSSPEPEPRLSTLGRACAAGATTEPYTGPAKAHEANTKTTDDRRADAAGGAHRRGQEPDLPASRAVARGNDARDLAARRADERPGARP
jgi:hypothetical protein